MKRILLLNLFFFQISILYSQVGIGTTTPEASLDITSTTNGLLIPRIALTSKDIALPVVNPNGGAIANATLIYNTATDGVPPNDVVPGFYFWDSTISSWVPIAGTATVSNAWDLNGNLNTSPSTNFIGTIDDQDLVFKRASTQAGLISYSNIGFGSGSIISMTSGQNNASFGHYSLSSNTTGDHNAAFGNTALFANTEGYQNSAFGSEALSSNTTGLFNNAFGTGSLMLNVSGESNTAIGEHAQAYNQTGNANTSLGNYSLFQNNSGNGNTILGNESFYNCLTGDYNVGIGYQAGYYETGSNKLYIENSNANAINALVYGEFDNKIFRVNGGFQIGNPLGTGYKFPLTRGTNGQVLQTDASGNVTWQTPSSGGSAWNLTGNTGTNSLTNFIGTTDNQDVIFKRNNTRAGMLNGSSTSFGVNALVPNPSSTGTLNTAIGVGALNGNQSGSNNVATGNGSLLFNTTGSHNSGFGAYSLFQNISGSNNVAVGENALQSNNGSQNTAVGFSALNGISTGNNNIGIGNNAQVPAGTANDQLSIANEIYGTSLSSTSIGKIGIGESNPSAKLQISASNQATPANTDGIIIPKIDTFPLTIPTAAQHSMIVYLTTISGTNGPGFYFWDNTVATWKPLISPVTVSGGWGLTGNTGTVPGTNFLGTTDNKDLQFKRANTRAGLLGNSNTAFGVSALNPTGTGANNTVIGVNALGANTTGSNNVIMGLDAAPATTTGGDNVVLGSEALFTNTTGSGNVALGYQAGFSETGSNKLYISNTSGGATNALVYGEFDNKIFRLNGTFQIGNPAGTGYVFPLARGTNGQVLQTNATGVLSWATPAAGGSGWGLTGNAGTTPATNFIGTTDNQDLVFKRFNVKSGQLGTINSSYGVSALNAITTGTNNTAIGVSSLGATTTGSWNTANGYQCLFSNTTGIANTAFGNTTLFSNTIGQHNTGIGVNSLYYNTTGTTNTATGSNSLFNNSTGSGNTANGFSSLNANTIGSFNSAFGSNSLNLNTTGLSNVSIGALSLYSNTIGSYNTANGQNALFYNLTGNNNIGLGYGSLYSNSTGNGNIAIGYQSGYNELGSNKLYIENSSADAVNALVYGEFDTNILRINGTFQIGNPAGTGYVFPLARGINGQVLQTNATGVLSWTTPAAGGSGWGLTGNAGTTPGTNFLGTTDDIDLVFKRFNIKSGLLGINNTSWGSSSLNANTTGYNNTSIGSLSLSSNTSGYNNTALGFRALNYNTTGIQNVAIGYGSLLSNNGNANTAIGDSSLFTNSTGSSNTTVGAYSLNKNTTGFNNSAFGVNTLLLNTTGISNSSYGTESLKLNTTGSNNVALGVSSLIVNSTGSNNVAIGNNSLSSNVTGNSNIAIGNQAGLNETGSNKLYIENSNADAVNALVYGEFDTNVLRINGNLQIGNPTGTGYNFPLARGTAGQTLQTDAIGNVTWQTPAASGSGWGLTGNAGTTPATNFIGTTDNNDLVFKRFNTKAGIIAASNTSIGVNTLAAASFAGTNDTAFGTSALYFNTSGTNNTATGSATLYYNTTGGYNTADGNSALFNNSTGIQNTAVGYTALNGNTNGNQNSALGASALSSLGVNCYNNIGIGFNAQVPNNINGSNQVRIGDTNITYAGIQVAWTTTSDRRWKTDIKDMDLGLNFISKLRPVSYVRNNDSKKSIEFGLIAQELEATLNDFNIKNAGIISKDDNGFYGVRYNDLIAPMIKSIQELKTENDELKAKNEILEKRLQAIEEKLK